MKLFTLMTLITVLIVRFDAESSSFLKSENLLFQKSFGTYNTPVALSFSPDSQTLATLSAYNDLTLLNLNLASSNEVPRTANLLFGPHLTSMSYSKNGTDILIGRLGNSIVIYDTINKKMKTNIVLDFNVTALATLPSSNEVVVGSNNGTIYLVDLKRKRQRAIYSFSGAVTSLDVSANGHLIGVTTDQSETVVIDFKIKKVIFRYNHPEKISSLSIEVNSISMLTAFTLFDKTMVVDLKSGNVIQEIRQKEVFPNRLTFDKTGKWLAIGYTRNQVDLVNINGSEVVILEEKSPSNNPLETGIFDNAITALSISNDGHFLAVASDSNYIKLFKINSLLKY